MGNFGEGSNLVLWRIGGRTPNLKVVNVVIIAESLFSALILPILSQCHVFNI